MSPLGWLGISCLLAMLASLSGGWLPNWIRFTHRRTQLLCSLVGGLMLGIAFFVMLPHAVEVGQSLDRATIWLMAGLLVMFVMLRMFHFHDHSSLDGSNHHDHDHDCGHDHDHDHDHGLPQLHTLGAAPAPQASMRWVGMTIGLGVHTFLDGVALAAQVEADAQLGHGGWLGLGTLLAIVLHKPMDSMAITSVMAASGWSSRLRQIVNFGYACTLPLGALAFYFSVGTLGTWQAAVIAGALAFSAGAFLCIALADLLPEVQFHSHDRWTLSALLLVGVFAAYVTEWLHHAGHDHSHGGPSHAHALPHDDHGHADHEHDEHEGHSHEDEHGHAHPH